MVNPANTPTIAANLGLVRKVAYHYAVRSKGVAEYDDLLHEGVIGLAQALERYNPDVAKLSSYAVPHIRGAILHYLRDRCTPGGFSHYPRHAGKVHLRSLDEPIDGHPDLLLVDVLPSADKVDEGFWVWDCVEELPCKIQRVMWLYYYDDRTQRDIARELNVTAATITRRHKKGLKSLKERLYENIVQDSINTVKTSTE